MPRRVGIDSGEVVGPSAGLAFAVTVFDLIRDDLDLLKGRHVTLSGSVGSDGSVVTVGRIRQKAIAAQQSQEDLLLVPKGNAAEANAAISEACSEGEGACTLVVPIESVAEAIALLELPDAELERAVATGSTVAAAAPLRAKLFGARS